MSRGEPTQPRSEPVKEELAKALDDIYDMEGKHEEGRRAHALDLAFQIENHNAEVKGAATISVEQLLKDAKAIELYLKGEIE